MTRGLYIGRFQPFHKGHLAALEWILQRESEVIIGIGSAQYSHTLKNPFTLGERIEMIWSVIKEKRLTDRVLVTGIPDTDNHHSLWVSLVLAWVPKFDVAYTNDPLSRRLFKEAGVNVKSIPLYKRGIYRATTIRELMIRGERWEELVPEAVARFIKKIGGEQRLREIYGATQR